MSYKQWWEQFASEHDEWRYADSEALRKAAFEAGQESMRQQLIDSASQYESAVKGRMEFRGALIELRQQLASAQERIEGVKEQRDTERAAYLNEFEKNQVIVAENARLRQQLEQWNEKAKNWMASPEAGKQLDGYRAMGAKCAELEAKRDELRQHVTLLRDAIVAIWTNPNWKPDTMPRALIDQLQTAYKGELK